MSVKANGVRQEDGQPGEVQVDRALREVACGHEALHRASEGEACQLAAEDVVWLEILTALGADRCNVAEG